MTRSAIKRDGRKVATHTRDTIVEALRRYEALYGGSTSASFNPATAKWGDRDDLIERYYGPDGPWPSLNTIRGVFGTFNAAREAAGLPINKAGPNPRRVTGEHRPIRDVREHRIAVPSERTLTLARDLARAEARADRAEARAERAETRAARPVPAPVRVEERVRVERVERVKVKEKIIKVRDERAIERLRTKLADEAARTRAADAQVAAAVRDLDLSRVALDAAGEAVASARTDAREAERERERAEDRLAAADARVATLVAERDEALGRAAEGAERALAEDFVRAAERRADAAEERAARAERAMREQGAAVTGEARRLTRAEIDELRTNGPAGPQVLAEAIKAVAKARSRGSGVALVGALTQLASASIGWRDRL